MPILRSRVNKRAIGADQFDPLGEGELPGPAPRRHVQHQKARAMCGSKREIIRCLERYVAREVYRALTGFPADASSPA